ncbi:MAG: AMP phosphorylase [Candidatus Methanomethylicaceae archaeon]|nr:AMP phosphorylase [Candidatus Verstraetearchaeota archaeon]
MNTFKVKIIDIITGEKSIVLNEIDAKTMMLRLNDRVRISRCGEGIRGKCDSIVCFLEITNTLVNQGEVGVYRDLLKEFPVDDGEFVEINPAPTPLSVEYIKKKMKGQKLDKSEIIQIVKDVVSNSLSPLEIAAFLMTEEYVGMDMDEIESLTRAMVETGTVIDFEEPVVDKHSIGGVPGNKVTLLIVPIVAAMGLKIPKTSSRAITSPSGTADTMEVLAPVEFSVGELKRLIKKVGGYIAWGGSLNIAPADDIFIKVEHPLSIDPHPQMLASIMAKKLAVGVKTLVMDIPVGKGAKASTFEEARKLSNDFIELGERLGIRTKCGITYGGQPVGHTVGPALEAKEALETLMGNGPNSLIEKSTALAGILFEMTRIATKGNGQAMAKEILRSGKAYQKMREIIEAQGGNPNIKPEEIPLGDKRYVLIAPTDGYISNISNSSINAIARAAGAPMDKGAGVKLYAKMGYAVKKGDPIIEIYAERYPKLKEAIDIASRNPPFMIEGMLLEEIPGF